MNGEAPRAIPFAAILAAVLLLPLPATAGAPDLIWEQHGHPGRAAAITRSPDGQTVTSFGDGCSEARFRFESSKEASQ
jgi:hypothetical protein